MAQVNLTLHPQQSEAFLSAANEIMYGGAAGGGKSHLMRAVAITLCADIAGLQVYLFRRLSDDLYKNHMEGPGGFLAMLSEWVQHKWVRFNGSKNYIEFWNGSKIWLSHCQYEKDLIKYQGPEFHVLLIDELTHFTEKQYRYLRGRCRLGGLEIPAKYKGKLPLIIAGTNPGGVGHNWVKRVFVDAAPAMQIHRAQRNEGGMLRQFIPALAEHNPTLLKNDPDYLERLEGLGDPALVKAMRSGDWNIVSGGALDDVWTSRVIKPRFRVPSSWRIDRSFDWGSSHPFSVGWWAEADGTEATLEDGTVFCPPRGSLVRIFEWYGTVQIGTNIGLKLDPREISNGILERERELLANKWITQTPKPGPADTQIRDVVQKNVETIEQQMASLGVRWTGSDKSPGSRINGLELVRTRLKEAGKDHPEQPALYFMDNCRASIALLPTLPRDEKKPDDVNTAAEDHNYDEIRYRVLATKRQAMSINMGTAY